jgi:hypothetical protein
MIVLYLAYRIDDIFFSVVMDVIPVDKAVSLADSIHCRLKLLLKELLSRVS